MLHSNFCQPKINWHILMSDPLYLWFDFSRSRMSYWHHLMTSRMNFCSKNIERVPLFYCNFDSISFCVLTTSVLILDCNFKTTSTFLSVVSFKVYSTKKSSSQESDDKYVWDYDQGKFTDEIFGNICKRLHVNFPKWRKIQFLSKLFIRDL